MSHRITQLSNLFFVATRTVAANKPRSVGQLDNPIKPSFTDFFRKSLKIIRPAKIPANIEFNINRITALTIYWMFRYKG